MPRYFLEFAYDGTDYHGWQMQPNQVSVQEVMTERMRLLFGSGFSLTGAGRTDAGVHAESMVAHFDCDYSLEPQPMVSKLNSLLPNDIEVFSIRAVRDDAHARFDALSRTYEYRFVLGKQIFLRRYATRLFTCPDVDAMNQACSLLFDYSDFTSFSKVHTDVKTNNCRIMQAFWEHRGEQLVFTIQADRFLRNMVRAIVGTMLEVGRQKLSLDGFRRVVESKNRCAAGTSVPAKGLFLTKVIYPEELYL